MKKAVKGSLTSNKIFKQTNDTKWTIRDKEFAEQILKATQEKMQVNLNKQTNKHNKDSNENKQDIKLRKKSKRRVDTYQKIAGLLDKCCEDLSKKKNGSSFLKNPFKALKGGEEIVDIYKQLGSNEKIIGILQCFEFFQPLISNGISNIGARQDN